MHGPGHGQGRPCRLATSVWALCAASKPLLPTIAHRCTTKNCRRRNGSPQDPDQPHAGWRPLRCGPLRQSCTRCVHQPLKAFIWRGWERWKGLTPMECLWPQVWPVYWLPVAPVATAWHSVQYGAIAGGFTLIPTSHLRTTHIPRAILLTPCLCFLPATSFPACSRWCAPGAGRACARCTRRQHHHCCRGHHERHCCRWQLHYQRW